MSRRVNFSLFAVSAVAVLGLLVLAGAKSRSGNACPSCGCWTCGSSAVAASPSTNGGSSGSTSLAAASEEIKGLEGLSAADRKAAEKQKTCPVSDELLGSIGTPVKVSVKGRDVFLCCGGCKGKLLKDPDFYLKKLDKQNHK